MMRNQYKYLGVIAILYITFQLVSDVTAGKIITLGIFTVSASAIYFPFTYIISDVLTEVYGYAKARSVLWIVMICSIIAGLLYLLVAQLPPASSFLDNDAYVTVFNRVPRILVGGWIAVFAGDIINNYILAKLKIITKGKYLWIRTITSTIFGQGVNTFIFYIIGLYGVIPSNVIVTSILAGWFLKVMVEILFTPVTYFVVSRLKKIEEVDHYDVDTNFNPFILKSPF